MTTYNTKYEIHTAVEALKALIQREKSGRYKIDPYNLRLAALYEEESRRNPAIILTDNNEQGSSETTTRGHSALHLPSARSQIVQWMCEFVDCNGLSRRLVPTSMNFFDRYMTRAPGRSASCSHYGCSCGGHYVLTVRDVTILSATCMYLTCKLDQGNVVRVQYPSVVVDDDRLSFGPRDVCMMEKKLLCGLSYNLLPPTVPNYLQELLFILSDTLLLDENSSRRNDIWTASKHLAVMALDDSFLMSRKVIHVALASVKFATSKGEWNSILKALDKFTLGLSSFDDQLSILESFCRFGSLVTTNGYAKFMLQLSCPHVQFFARSNTDCASPVSVANYI